MKLYEIANEYQHILDGMVDPESGEIVEGALEKLDALTVGMQEKSLSVASYIKNLDAEYAAIDGAVCAMAARRDAILKRIRYLQDYLKANMLRCEISEISCPYFQVKIRKSPQAVNIHAEALLPQKYIKEKVEYRPDKTLIKNDLKSGVEVPGAELTQGSWLEIR